VIIHRLKGPCLFQSLLVAIRQQYPSRQAIKNFIPCMQVLAIWITRCDVHIHRGWHQLPYFPSRKVRHFLYRCIFTKQRTTASKKHRKSATFQTFCRQLYHACLTRVFSSLRPSMTTPEVARCPDGHYRCIIFSLGPYIADYPEQVWLAGIVQHWCAT
jgi:Plavaka transposase